MASPTRSRRSPSTPDRRPDDGLRATSALEDVDCAVCGRAVPHELVECVDGHGEDCPDRVCTGCGGVLVVGSTPLWLRRSA